MAARSEWRTRARQIIADVLNALPADATLKQKRKALQDAYPWGEREHHPYKMWLKEQAIALKKIADEDAKNEPSGVCWCLVKHGVMPWIEVACTFCYGKVRGGCLLCVSHVKLYEKLVRDREYLAIREDAMRDARFVSLMLDWLKDHGAPEIVDKTQPGKAKKTKGG